MFRYLFLLMAFVGLEGCQETPTDADVNIDEIFSTDTVEDGQLNVEAMKVLSVNFSPDRKYFHVYVGFNHDVGPYHFTDSNDVTIKVSESVGGILQEKKTAAFENAAVLNYSVMHLDHSVFTSSLWVCKSCEAGCGLSPCRASRGTRRRASVQQGSRASI